MMAIERKILILITGLGLLSQTIIMAQSVNQAAQIVNRCYQAQKQFAFVSHMALRVVVHQTTIPKPNKGEIQDLEYELVSNGKRSAFFSEYMDVLLGDSLLLIAYHKEKRITVERLSPEAKREKSKNETPVDKFFHCLTAKSSEWSKTKGQLKVDMFAEPTCAEKYGVASVLVVADTLKNYLSYMKTTFIEDHPVLTVEYEIKSYDPKHNDALVSKDVLKLIKAGGDLFDKYKNYRIVRNPIN